MDFTREPIIQSIVTPKQGCKLVIRSSKGVGQEEFFVDAVEVVSFGSTFFLRSLEKPKAFLVPATDYEILEVRETRMVLKNVGLDRSIKIGGGREGVKKQKVVTKPEIPEPKSESKVEQPKRRERRRHYRRRRVKEEEKGDKSTDKEDKAVTQMEIPVPEQEDFASEEKVGKPIKPSPSVLSTLLPPPPTLISESIERYKASELFRNVFIPEEEAEGEKSKESLLEEARDEESSYLEDVAQESDMSSEEENEPEDSEVEGKAKE